MNLEHISRPALIRLAQAKRKLEIRAGAGALSGSLTEFTRAAWPQLERKKYVHNWHIDAIAEHLEAVSRREIRRLIINVPFRTMKSTLVNVAWPAWIWTRDPGHQFLCGSHAEKLATRDNLKHRRLVTSPWYRERWGSKFKLTGDQNQKLRFENDQNGYRIGFGMTSGITGDGGDTVIIDDPHDRDKAQSEAEREKALETFDQSIVTRLNDPESSAIVVIMQRLHECLLPGTLVRTPDGERVIEEIRAGDTVYGSDGWQTVQFDGSRAYDGTAYGVRLYGHPTTCWTTDNHLYLTKDGWKRADQITKRDWVKTPKPSTVEDVPWEAPRRAVPPGVTGTFTGARTHRHRVDAELLRKFADDGKTVTEIGRLMGLHRNTVQCHMALHGITRLFETNSFKNTDHLADPEFWRFVGYWLAEGSVSGSTVRVTFAEDEPHYVAECLATMRRYGVTCGENFKPSTHEAQICSSQLATWLKCHFGSGAHHKRVAEFVFGLPAEHRREVLEGWLRGDGCVRAATGQRSGASVSLSLIHGMQQIALSLGIRCMIVGTRGEPKANVIAGRKSVSCGTSYELRLEVSAKCEARFKSKIDQDGAWYRVKSIETKPYSGPVYDITTPSHDFVVGNATIHNSDLSGHLLADGGWEHLMLPMEYDPGRHCVTSLGFEDPRTEPGELLWPERFPEHVVADLARSLGPYGTSGQLQQMPTPAGGGILQVDWWQPWGREEALRYGLTWSEDERLDDGTIRKGRREFPEFSFVIASLDGAFGQKQENDPSALTVWGRFSDLHGNDRFMLVNAWEDRLPLHELVQKVATTCKKYRVDRLLIEAKANGHDVASEMQRLHGREKWLVELIDPGKLDKVARAHSVVPLFAEGMIHAPETTWAQMVINQCMIAGTMIITKYGLKPIEAIEVGDLVLTHKGRFRPVLAVSSRPAKGVVRLEPKTLDPMTLTPEHPLFAMDLTCERRIADVGWVKAGDIKAREYRDVVRGGKTYQEAIPSRAHAATLPVIGRETPIDEVDLREWATLPSGKRYDVLSDDEYVTTQHGRLKEIRWRQSLDHTFGRVMGLYLAEGCTRRGQTAWSFHAEEREFIQEIESFAADRLGIAAYKETVGNCTTVRMNIPLADGFFGECGRKAEHKKIPEWVWDAPDEFVRGLLAGYIDGDGHVSESGVTTGTTVSQSLAWGIRLLGLRVGIYASVRLVREAGTAKINGRQFNTLPSYAVNWRDARCNEGAATVGDGVVGYSIMKSEHDQEVECEVFNMDVAEDHSYCTTSGLVHNCASFPKATHDDLVDSTTQAIRWLRDNNLAARNEEIAGMLADEAMNWKRPHQPLYPGV